MEHKYTIDEYIISCAPSYQERLHQIKEAILSQDASLQERMSWNMPTFWKEKNIIHFALHKNHIGIYPGPKAMEHFQKELSSYQCSKGAFQIPHDQKLPLPLIKAIVKYNLKN